MAKAQQQTLKKGKTAKATGQKLVKAKAKEQRKKPAAASPPAAAKSKAKPKAMTVSEIGRHVSTNPAMSLEDKMLALKGTQVTAKGMDEFLSVLPTNEQQLVWKRFEHARMMERTDEQFKAETVGAGAVSKKRQLLAAFLATRSTKSELYSTVLGSLTVSKLDERQQEWVSWQAVVDKYGKEEALQRLTSGAVEKRRDPSSNQLWQFKLVRQLQTEKVQEQRRHEAAAKSKLAGADYAKLMAMLGEQCDSSSFSGADELPPDLASQIGLKVPKNKAAEPKVVEPHSSDDDEDNRRSVNEANMAVNKLNETGPKIMDKLGDKLEQVSKKLPHYKELAAQTNQVKKNIKKAIMEVNNAKPGNLKAMLLKATEIMSQAKTHMKELQEAVDHS